MGMIFGMWVCLGGRMLIFEKSRSKVKGQGRKSTKICLFWAIFGHRSWVCVRSGPGRVRWGTFGSVPTKFGIVPNIIGHQGASSRKVSQCWQVANVAGMVPKMLKVPEPKYCAIARCKVYLSIYITCISVSMPTPWAVAGPNGQLASLKFPVL